MLGEKRRLMKRGGTTGDNLEYIQTCKAIRQGMKDDILAFNEKQVLKAIEKYRSLKHARLKQCLGKKQLISIMEEDGTQIHNRDCIVTHCVEFYQELYRSRMLQTNTMEPQQPHRLAVDDAPPIILPTEVEASIKKLDCSKAPVEDNITGVFYKMQGSHSQPLHSTLQQVPSILPSSKSMSECSDDLAAHEGQHIRHKELQANQFAPHHLHSLHTSFGNGYCRL